MKNILYIGNYLQRKQANPSYMFALGRQLEKAGYKMIFSSSKNNKALRLVDMFFNIINNKDWADVVLIDTYSTQNFYYAYYCSILCRKLKLNYVPILHGGNLGQRLKSNPKKSKTIFSNATFCVSPTQFIKSQFEEAGYDNIVLIPNAIDVESIPFKKREFNKPSLIWVRSFSSIYNPEMAINVMEHLKNENLDVELMMIGPDPQNIRKDLEKEALQKNLTVEFFNKMTKEEWYKKANKCNIFLNTSNFDNMPVTLLEAMALGLLIISTEVGGIPFMMKDSQTAHLVPKNDAKSMAMKVIQCIENPEASINMVDKAHSEVQGYSWKRIIPRWKKVLE